MTRSARSAGCLRQSISASLRFDQIIVDLHAAVFEALTEVLPLVEKICDGLPHFAPRKESACLLQLRAEAMEACHDGAAAFGAHSHADSRAAAGGAQGLFNMVEILHLPDDEEADGAALIAGLVELPPGVCHATAKDDGRIGAPAAAADEGSTGSMAFALRAA